MPLPAAPSRAGSLPALFLLLHLGRHPAGDVDHPALSRLKRWNRWSFFLRLLLRFLPDSLSLFLFLRLRRLFFLLPSLLFGGLRLGLLLPTGHGDGGRDRLFRRRKLIKYRGVRFPLLWLPQLGIFKFGDDLVYRIFFIFRFPAHTSLLVCSIRCRTASYSKIAAALEALRDEIRPFWGIRTT